MDSNSVFARPRHSVPSNSSRARWFFLVVLISLAGLSNSPGIARETRGGSGDTLFLAGHAVYKRSAPAVVGITCYKGKNLFFGTGAIINSGGLVLTSTTVVPSGARRLHVYVRGGREVPAKLLHTDTKKELALLRVEPRRLRRQGGEIPVLPLGVSTAVQPGQTVYALGNAFQSIFLDDQVAVSEGVVSDLFKLTERRSESTYLGPAIGTSALVNGGMDGGPLVDASGRLIGMLSLNYSKYNWLGTAIPIDVLKPVLKKHHDCFSDGEPGTPVFLGLQLESYPSATKTGWSIRVLGVDKESPAGEAGIRVGDEISTVDDKPLRTLDDLRRRLRDRRPGSKLKLRLKPSSEAEAAREVTLSLWGKL